MSYVTVKIPKELIREIDELIKKQVGGYKSRPELIKEAIRMRLKEVKTLFAEAEQQDA